MRNLSRHLPPASPAKEISRVTVCVVLGICAIIVAVALRLQPIRPAMFVFISSVSIFTGIAVILSRLGDKKFEILMSGRKGENICSFRKTFDVRQVDPWIIRAVHEEISGFIEKGKANVAIRASDRLLEDLQIDPEDLEDIAAIIAARAGYDFSVNISNPLFGKVNTVGDLVMYFTYQRKIRP